MVLSCYLIKQLHLLLANEDDDPNSYSLYLLN